VSTTPSDAAGGVATTGDVAAAVWAALGSVRDPELDEPVTELGFVARCIVDADGLATVRLRLPTYFCAANFAFLMVADAHAAVAAVPGVRRADVALDAHFAADAINDGVTAGHGFVASFDGLARDELDDLRADFLRKAVAAATERVCRPLLDGGRRAADLAGLTLGDAPPSAERDRLVARRAELGLPAGDGDPLLVDPASGQAVGGPDAELHLRKARLTRVSLETNGEVCRGLLRQRYPEVAVELAGTGVSSRR
jgi:metal-sulfur cluster biosynthetic enzyme